MQRTATDGGGTGVQIGTSQNQGTGIGLGQCACGRNRRTGHGERVATVYVNGAALAGQDGEIAVGRARRACKLQRAAVED